jgi:hypothetical protein
MTRTSFHPRNVRITLTVAGAMIAALSIGTPAALAKDAYPPGWNVKTDVPPSTVYTWIPSYVGNLPYWADQDLFSRAKIPSRYSPDQCHWDWCKKTVQKPGTATAQMPQAK